MLWVVRRRWWILAAGLALFLLGIEPPDPGGWDLLLLFPWRCGPAARSLTLPVQTDPLPLGVDRSAPRRLSSLVGLHLPAYRRRQIAGDEVGDRYALEHRS